MNYSSLLRQLPKPNATDWEAYTQIGFLSVLEAESLRSECRQGLLLLRPLSLAHGCDLTWPFLCGCTTLASLPLLRTPVLLDQAPPWWVHLTLFTSLKAHLPIQSHSRLGFQHKNVERAQVGTQAQWYLRIKKNAVKPSIPWGFMEWNRRYGCTFPVAGILWVRVRELTTPETAAQSSSVKLGLEFLLIYVPLPAQKWLHCILMSQQ